MNFFVDKHHPNSSDLNPGTENFPWKSILRATLAPEISGDDTVYIKEGTYHSFIPGISPAKDKGKIVYQAFKDDSVVVTTGKPLLSNNLNWQIKSWCFDPRFYSIVNCTEIVAPSVIKIDFSVNPFYNGHFVYIPSLSSYSNFYDDKNIENNRTIFKVISSNEYSIIINIGTGLPVGAVNNFVTTILNDGKVAQPAVKLSVQRNENLFNDYKEFNHHLDCTKPLLYSSSSTLPTATASKFFTYYNGSYRYFSNQENGATTIGDHGIWGITDISLSGHNDCFYNDFILITSLTSHPSFNQATDRFNNTFFSPFSAICIDFKNLKTVNGKTYSNWRVLSAGKDDIWIESFFTPTLTGINNFISETKTPKLYNSWYIADPYRDTHYPVLSNNFFDIEQQNIPSKASCYSLNGKNLGYWAIRLRKTLHHAPVYNYNIFNYNPSGTSSFFIDKNDIVNKDYPFCIPLHNDRNFTTFTDGNSPYNFGWKSDTTILTGSSNSSTNPKAFWIRKRNRTDFNLLPLNFDIWHFSFLNYLRGGKTNLREPIWPLHGWPNLFYLTSPQKNYFLQFYNDTNTYTEENDALSLPTYSEGLISEFITIGQENLLLQGAKGDRASTIQDICQGENERLQKGNINPIYTGSLQPYHFFYGIGNSTLYVNVDKEKYNLDITAELNDTNSIFLPCPIYSSDYDSLGSTLVYECSADSSNRIIVVSVNNGQDSCKSYNTTHIFRPGNLFCTSQMYTSERFSISGYDSGIRAQTIFKVISSYYDKSSFNTVIDFSLENGQKINLRNSRVIRISKIVDNIEVKNLKFIGIKGTNTCLKNVVYDNCVFQLTTPYSTFITDDVTFRDCLMLDAYDLCVMGSNPKEGKTLYERCFFEKNNKIAAWGASDRNKSVYTDNEIMSDSVVTKQRDGYAKWYDMDDTRLQFLDNEFIKADSGGIFTEINDNLVRYPLWNEWEPNMMVAFDGIADNTQVVDGVTKVLQYTPTSKATVFSLPPLCRADNLNYIDPSSPSNFYDYESRVLRYSFPSPGSLYGPNLKTYSNYRLRAISAINYGVWRATGLSTLTGLSAMTGNLNPFEDMETPVSFFKTQFRSSSVTSSTDVLFDGNVFWIVDYAPYIWLPSYRWEIKNYLNSLTGYPASTRNSRIINNVFDIQGWGIDNSSTGNYLIINNTFNNSFGIYHRFVGNRGTKTSKNKNSTITSFITYWNDPQGGPWSYTACNILNSNNIYTTNFNSHDQRSLKFNALFMQVYGEAGVPTWNPFPGNNPYSYPILGQQAVGANFHPYKYAFFPDQYCIDSTATRNLWNNTNTNNISTNSFDGSDVRVINIMWALTALNLIPIDYNSLSYTTSITSDSNLFDKGLIEPRLGYNYNDAWPLSTYKYTRAIGTSYETAQFTLPYSEYFTGKYKIEKPVAVSLAGDIFPENNSIRKTTDKIKIFEGLYFRDETIESSNFSSLTSIDNYRGFYKNTKGSTLRKLFDKDILLKHNVNNNITLTTLIYDGPTLVISDLKDKNNIISIKTNNNGQLITWNPSNRDFNILEKNKTYFFAISGNVELLEKFNVFRPISDNYNIGGVA